MVTSLKWLFLFAVAGYLALVALLYLAQRSLLYFPDPRRLDPVAAGLRQAEEVMLQSADGVRVSAWHVPAREGIPVVIYFQGNGGGLDLRADRFRKLTADGTGLLALNYRGYGGSGGSPSEAGIILDARAAYDFAAERYGADRIVLWGESLGTGVAVAIASEKPVTHVILDAPYSSTADIASDLYWFLPVRLLMKDQFRSDERIRNVKAPVLILHGEADDIIPIRYGERLLAMIPGEKRLVRFPHGYHVDLDRHGAMDVALKFLAEP